MPEDQEYSFSSPKAGHAIAANLLMVPPPEDEIDYDVNDGDNNLLTDTMALIKKGNKSIAEAVGQSIVVFLGSTGSGKSTAINFISGCTMLPKENNDTGDFYIECADPIVDIGNGAQSKTLYPKIVKPKEKVSARDSFDFKFCDNAGFGDNRGAKYDICAAYTLGYIFEKAREIRGIVVLIQKSDLTDARLTKLLSTFEHLNDLIVDNEKYKGSFLFAVTKTDSDKRTFQQLYNLLKLRYQQLKQPQDGTGATVNLSRTNWLFEEMLADNGKNMQFCVPVVPASISGKTNDAGREDLLKAIKALSPVTHAEGTFKYPITKDSELVLRKLLIKLEKELITLIDQFRTLYFSILNTEIKHEDDVNSILAIQAEMHQVCEQFHFQSSQEQKFLVDDFLNIPITYSSDRNDLDSSMQTIQVMNSDIENLNHFLGEDNNRPELSRSIIVNFQSDFVRTSENISEVLTEIWGEQLLNLLFSRSIQQQVWHIRTLLVDNFMSINELNASKLQEMAEKITPFFLSEERTVAFNDLIDKLLASTGKGVSKIENVFRQAIEKPFTQVETLQGKTHAIIKSNTGNLFVSQVLLALMPIEKQLEFQALWLLASGAIILDSSLSKKLVGGKNVVIAANNLESPLEGTTIDVSGLPISNSTELGKLGRSGNSAGNIHIVTQSDKVLGYPITLFANGSHGGKGASGARGKEGAAGTDGKDAIAPAAMGDVICIWDKHDKFIRGTKGEQGGIGGKGSSATPGGYGGRKGSIVLDPPALTQGVALQSSTNGIDGVDGVPGHGGPGGPGGKNGYDILAIKAGTQFKTDWFKGYIESYIYKNEFFTHSVRIKGKFTQSKGGSTPPSKGPERTYASKGKTGQDGQVVGKRNPQHNPIEPIAVDEIKRVAGMSRS